MSKVLGGAALAGLTESRLDSDVLTPLTDVSTLAALSFFVASHFPGKVVVKRALAKGAFEMTGRQLFDEVRALSLALIQLGIEPGDRVAIVSDSRPEWAVADLAIISAGAVTVPVYPTQSGGQIEFILRDSCARAVIVSTSAQLEKVRRVRDRLPQLDLLFVMDVPPGAPAFPDALPLSEVSNHGRALLEADPAAADLFRSQAFARREGELATIVYTMDESGDLKGAMLTHANLLSDVRATEDVLPLREDDVALSLLPLSHVFERMALYRYLRNGVTVVFVESLMTVMRDLKRVCPTVMTGVPRVWEKFLSAVEEDLARASRTRRALVRWALAVGRTHAAIDDLRRHVPPGLRMAHRLADRFVLARIRQAVGGRLRLVVSGSAALPQRVSDFFASIGIPIFEGYGLTETSPVLTTNGPGHARQGTVGKALPGIDVRIASDGEILARGPNVTCGYLNRPDINARAFEGGWFRTGDIGVIDADGYLTITDRKKDLIVTAGGKKIAPSPLESRLMAHPLVADAILLGENRKFPSMLIVPRFDALREHMKQLGVTADSMEELLQRADVVQLYQNLVDELNVGLAQFERIKRLALLPKDVTLSRDRGGATMFERRQAIERDWQPIVDRLYRTENA